MQDVAPEVLRFGTDGVGIGDGLNLNALGNSLQLWNIISRGKALDVAPVKFLGDSEEVVVSFLDLAFLDSIWRILESA